MRTARAIATTAFEAAAVLTFIAGLSAFAILLGA